MTLRRVLLALLGLVAVLALYVAGAWFGFYGRHEGAGAPTTTPIPATVVSERAAEQRASATALSVAPPDKQILFGDLHVHTTFSTDAFLRSLPMLQGEGAHPVSDACDFARFCSSLDFWSINDHAEAITPQRWRETGRRSAQCNAVAGDEAEPGRRRVPRLGVEPGRRHARRITTDTRTWCCARLADAEVPARPIGAAGLATRRAAQRARAHPAPAALRRLREPPALLRTSSTLRRRDRARCRAARKASSSKRSARRLLRVRRDARRAVPQARRVGRRGDRDPARQHVGLLHAAGHLVGQAARRRAARPVAADADRGVSRATATRRSTATGTRSCSTRTASRAAPSRRPTTCRAAGAPARSSRRAAAKPASTPRSATTRAAEARQHYADAGVAGHRTVPGVRAEEWLDAGQCRDCFLPAFNYRPGGSAQYALAISNFDDPASPRHFRFGFIASSDNHQARPGTGYKEFGRKGNTEARGAISAKWRTRLLGEPEPADPQSHAVDLDDRASGSSASLETERQASFFMTGGLAAVHADGRSRDAIWNALERKRGLRDQRRSHPALVRPAERAGTGGRRQRRADGRRGAHGGGAALRGARGRRASSRSPAARTSRRRRSTPARLEAPVQGRVLSTRRDERKPITRIEVVRIRPQARRASRSAALIDDPWRVFPCEPSQAGCVVQFEDPEFATSPRAAIYYVRAIEAPSPTVNAKNLRCETRRLGPLRRGEPLLRRLPNTGERRLPRRQRRARLVVADLRRSALNSAH